MTSSSKFGDYFSSLGTNTPRGERIAEVFPNLFVSSLAAAEDETLLQKHKITHILHIGTKTKRYINCYTEHCMTMEDDDMSLERFALFISEAIVFISAAMKNNKNNRVLLHCFMGSSRTPTVAAAYLFLTKRLPLLSLLDIYLQIREVAPWIYPPETFYEQIKEIADRQLLKLE